MMLRRNRRLSLLSRSVGDTQESRQRDHLAPTDLASFVAITAAASHSPNACCNTYRLSTPFTPSPAHAQSRKACNEASIRTNNTITTAFLHISSLS